MKFNFKDMVSLNYFDVLFTCDDITLIKSINTGDRWMLRNEGYYYTIRHSHGKGNYHHQTEVGTLFDAVLYIVSHDEFQMRNRRPFTKTEERSTGTFFFELVEMYGNG